jgi:hypothetical protein
MGDWIKPSETNNKGNVPKECKVSNIAIEQAL